MIDLDLDLHRIRADTSATVRLAYLHHAGAGLMPVPVVEAMKRHIDLEAEIGGYAAAAQGRRRGAAGCRRRRGSVPRRTTAIQRRRWIAWSSLRRD